MWRQKACPLLSAKDTCVETTYALSGDLEGLTRSLQCVCHCDTCTVACHGALAGLPHVKRLFGTCKFESFLRRITEASRKFQTCQFSGPRSRAICKLLDTIRQQDFFGHVTQLMIFSDTRTPRHETATIPLPFRVGNVKIAEGIFRPPPP